MMIKKLFTQLDSDYQLFLSTMPMSVYSTIDPDEESEDQFIAIRDRFVALPEDAKNKLSSIELAAEIKKIGDENKLKSLQIASIARAVRSYYFGDISAESFAAIFQKEMGIDQVLAKHITEETNKRILQRNFVNNEEYEKHQGDITGGNNKQIKNKLSMNISEALQKYPNLGEQGVSSNPLKLRYFPNPVRPSIKNWITDFHDNMGGGKHGAIDRGNYLFHGENGRKITPIERQKLSLILKSLDENYPLTIDPDEQKVIFQEEKMQESQIMNPQPRITSQEIPSKNQYIEKDVQKKKIYKNEVEQKDIFQKYISTNQQTKTYSPNFAKIKPAEVTAAEKEHARWVSFTSPQKFPVEQKKDVSKNFAQPTVEQKNIPQMQTAQPVKPAEKISRPLFQETAESRWQIKPSNYIHEEDSDFIKDAKPQARGNVVDLRS